MAKLSTILKEMNDEGKRVAAEGGDDAAAVALVAQKYGYDMDDLDSALDYYIVYGEAPTEGTLGFAREMAAGFAFEFADEGEAYVRSIFEDETYDEILEMVRADRRAYFDRNPTATIAANILGGVAMPAGVLGAAGKGAYALANPLKTGAMVGAGQGALTGLGAGETVGERMKGAAFGAPFGAAGGAVGTRLGQAIANRGMSARDRGLVRARQALEDDNVDIANIPNRIAANTARDAELGMGEPTEMLVDYGGQATRRVLRGAQTQNPAVSEEIGSTIANRQVGQGGLTTTDPLNPNQRVLSQGQRVQRELDAVADPMRPPPSGALVESMHAQQLKQPDIKELYDAAYGRNENFNNKEVFKAMVGNQDLRNSYNLARIRMIDMMAGRGLFEKLGDFEAQVPKNIDDILESNVGLPLEFIDMVKRQVGDSLWTAGRKFEKAPPELAERRKTLGLFINTLKKAVEGDEYEKVLKITADQFEISDAEMLGKKLYGKSASQMEEAIKGMKPAALDALRVSYLEEMIERVGRASRSRDKVETVVGSENADAVLEVLFKDKPEQLAKFIDRVRREREMTTTRRTLTQQSNTADKLVDANSMNPATAIDLARLATGNPTLESMARLARTAMGGQGTKTSTGVGQVLGDTNPATQARSIEDMIRLNRTLDMMNRRSLVGGGGIGSMVGTEAPASVFDQYRAGRRRRNFNR